MNVATQCVFFLLHLRAYIIIFPIIDNIHSPCSTQFYAANEFLNITIQVTQIGYQDSDCFMKGKKHIIRGQETRLLRHQV